MALADCMVCSCVNFLGKKLGHGQAAASLSLITYLLINLPW